ILHSPAGPRVLRPRPRASVPSRSGLDRQDLRMERDLPSASHRAGLDHRGRHARCSECPARNQQASVLMGVRLQRSAHPRGGRHECNRSKHKLRTKMLKKLLATVALISALVAPAYAGGVASDNTLPRQMTGTWCYDKELDSYLRQSCTDADVIVVKTDGYVNSSERCKFREVERVTDSLDLVRGRCVQSSELAVGGKITPIGNNGGLKFELINNLQLNIRELPSNSILKSLSPEIQKSIKETRNNCIRGFPTEGDDGLVAFIVSGKPAVLVDELNLCVDENHRGMQY